MSEFTRIYTSIRPAYAEHLEISYRDLLRDVYKVLTEKCEHIKGIWDGTSVLSV